MRAPEIVIELRNVLKRFGAVTAVNRISFSVKAGETVSLLGPSGCGKTTTLRLIAGFENLDEGDIEVTGKSMVGMLPYERNIGLLFQHYALFPHMTVAENVAYGLKRRQWPKAEIYSRVAEMLQLVQLTGFEQRRPGQLSGGQQQRVALARVLATKPSLVLLDEPLSALDAKLRQELRLEMKQILTSVGSTSIVVTHDQDEAMSLADRIIVMNLGAIEQVGTPEEIYQSPRTSFVAGFIGRTNWFHGQILGDPNGGTYRLTTDAGTALVIRKSGAAAIGKCSVCIRPERIAVLAPGVTTYGLFENLLVGQVVNVINMGAEIQYVVEGPDGRVMIIESNREGPKVKEGDRIHFGFRPEDCVILPHSPS